MYEYFPSKDMRKLSHDAIEKKYSFLQVCVLNIEKL